MAASAGPFDERVVNGVPMVLRRRLMGLKIIGWTDHIVRDRWSGVFC
jgi:hypothetical protein